MVKQRLDGSGEWVGGLIDGRRGPGRVLIALVTLAATWLGCDEPGTPFPELTASSPADGAAEVSRATWIVLQFADDVDAESLESLSVECDGRAQAHTATIYEATTVVINPSGELADGARCRTIWSAPDGGRQLAFTTAARGEPAVVPYDRADASQWYPFPDDAFTVEDPSSPTGLRVMMPDDEAVDRPGVMLALGDSVQGLDGFSPVAPIVVQLPGSLSLDSVSLDASASLEELAPIALYDIDPTGGEVGRRWAVDLQVRDEMSADGEQQQVLLAIPLAPLPLGRRMALVVERRAYVDPGRPLEPSSPQQESLSDAGAHAEILGLLGDSLDVPRHADDIALLLPFTVRSGEEFPLDLSAIAATTLATELSFTVERVEPQDDPSSPVAALVYGTFEALDYRDRDFLHRGADGLPEPVGIMNLPFVLALPRTAVDSPAPLIMYQHGNPGSAEDEVPRAATGQGLSDAGFAVLGFTDTMQRQIPFEEQAMEVFLTLLSERRMPDWVGVMPVAEQLSFLRGLESLATLDLLPLGATDGRPDLDVAAPLGYLGVSFGANHGLTLLAHTSQINAASLVTGGGRYVGHLLQQVELLGIYDLVSEFFPDLTRTDFYVALALLQTNFDPQDWINHARFVYDPTVGGSDGSASILLHEGLGDFYVPSVNTRGAAIQLGLDHIAPVESVPWLDVVDSPISANLATGATGVFAQFAAAGLDVPVTPGCERTENGHACGQNAPSAIEQRLGFFLSALDGTPTVTDAR